MSKVILTEGKDFTPAALVLHLNERHGGKKSGQPFTIQDIQQYIIRGQMPKSYGGKKVKLIKNEKIGIKIVRIYEGR